MKVAHRISFEKQNVLEKISSDPATLGGQTGWCETMYYAT